MARVTAICGVLAGLGTLAIAPATDATVQAITSQALAAPGGPQASTGALPVGKAVGINVKSSTGRKGKLQIAVSDCCGTATTVSVELSESARHAVESFTFPFNKSVSAHTQGAPEKGHDYMKVSAKGAFGSLHMTFRPSSGNLAPALVNGYPACYQRYAGSFDGKLSFDPHAKAWGRFALGKHLTVGNSELYVYLSCGFNGYPPVYCARSTQATLQAAPGDQLDAITAWDGPISGDTGEATGPPELIYEDRVTLRHQTVGREVEISRLPTDNITFTYPSGPFLIRISPKLAFAQGTLRVVATNPDSNSSSCEYHGKQGTYTYTVYSVSSLSATAAPLKFIFSIGPDGKVSGPRWAPSPTVFPNYEDQVLNNSFNP